MFPGEVRARQNSQRQYWQLVKSAPLGARSGLIREHSALGFRRAVARREIRRCLHHSNSEPWNSCGYGARFEDLDHGVHGRIDFGVAVVEVRREADSGFRPPVYEDIAGQQVAAYLLRFRHVD